MKKTIQNIQLITTPRTEYEIQAMLQRQKADIIPESTLNKLKIIECNEPLVSILDYAPNCIIDIKERRKRFPKETLYCRLTVAKSLAIICDKIAPLRPVIFDAFRPIEYQAMRFQKRFQEIKQQNPTWSNKEIREETFIYIFPPSDNPQRPPPHSTGGALDLTLANFEGIKLDMGYGYEFDKEKMYTNATNISKIARTNRELLINTMADQGFVNFPGEWWHFSLGDREWAAYLNIKEPVPYGRSEDPYKLKN